LVCAWPCDAILPAAGEELPPQWPEPGRLHQSDVACRSWWLWAGPTWSSGGPSPDPASYGAQPRER